MDGKVGSLKLVDHLRSIVGSEGLVYGEGLSDYSLDYLRPYRAYPELPRRGFRPDAVVMPSSADQVSQVVKFASKHRIPIVPYGGGTGLT